MESINITAVIEKIYPEIGLGYCKISTKIHELGEVYFRRKTLFLNTDFEKLEKGHKIHMEVVETPRGLLATSLKLLSDKKYLPKKSPITFKEFTF